MPSDRSTLIPALKNIATQLRIDSMKSTSEAGSGHPTSCFSAAELVATLFFADSNSRNGRRTTTVTVQGQFWFYRPQTR